MRHQEEVRSKALVLASQAGQTARSIARHLDLPASTVLTWVREASDRKGFAHRSYYAYPTVSAVDAAWVAGVATGFTFLAQAKPSGVAHPLVRWHRSTAASPGATDVAERLKRVTGVGSVHVRRPPPPRSPSVVFSANGFQDVARLQEIIIPFAPELAPAFAELWAKFTPADMENAHEAP